jgi:hypothetical protein
MALVDPGHLVSGCGAEEENCPALGAARPYPEIAEVTS